MDSREPSPDTNEYLDLSLLSEQSALYAVDGPEEELEGVVDRIVYENTENGFFVGRLRESDMGPLVTFVGNLMAVSPGETVRLKGRWVEDKRFGRQFRAAAAEVVLPTSAAGIERYLGSGLIPGIGPTYAKRLVDAFGVETLKVIGEQPERLRRVPGIGRKRAGQIQKAWNEQRSIQSVMIFLQSHGISSAQAVRIHKQYGDAAAATLRANPYRLARDISGIGFLTADRIARQMGIAADAPARVKAAMLHVLTTAGENGHVFYKGEELRRAASELLKLPENPFQEILGEMTEAGEIILDKDAWYLPSLYHAERGCSERLKRLLRAPLDHVPIQVENALKWVEKRVNISLSEEQREAVRVGVQAKVMVITGGPGTGKTTVIKSLMAIMEAKGVGYLLAAPTGRASKRMEAATGADARTIHRLLEFSPATGAFQRDEKNPLETDMLVVDEASMLDIELAHALFRALRPGTRLVLVGDVDQLPSVGPGNVLLDIIASGVVPVVRLKTVFRQGAQSGIITNAHRINRGEMPIFNDRDFFLIDRQEPDKALETIVEVASRRLPSRFGLHPLRDVQILAPMRKGAAGVENINLALKQALNPDGKPVPHRGFGVGDKVMQTRNNYELDVFNGDVGIVTVVDSDAGEIEVCFEDDRRVLYSLDTVDNLTTAYCTTVHKAQGSEYPAVVLSFLPQHYMMLQRNVLYTAITRGKKLVVIVGSGKAVAMAVHNSNIARRNSNLSDRLRNAL